MHAPGTLMMPGPAYRLTHLGGRDLRDEGGVPSVAGGRAQYPD